jgi:hypothetical protein
MHPQLRVDTPGYSEASEGSEDSGVIAATGPSREAIKKLDQIIQVISSPTVCVSQTDKHRIFTSKLQPSSCNPECRYL